MKLIKYKILSNDILTDVSIECSESILEETIQFVKMEAYNKDYTIEDDGKGETEETPSDSDRIAELEEALNMLLGGVTE